jgi:hypothetical protein
MDGLVYSYWTLLFYLLGLAQLAAYIMRKLGAILLV